MKSAEDRKKELRTLMKALDDEPIGPRDDRYFDFYRAAGHPRGADPIAAPSPPHIAQGCLDIAGEARRIGQGRRPNPLPQARP